MEGPKSEDEEVGRGSVRREGDDRVWIFLLKKNSREKRNEGERRKFGLSRGYNKQVTDYF